MESGRSDCLGDLSVLGRLPLPEAAAKLREVGEVRAATILEEAEETPPAFGIGDAIGRLLGADPRVQLYLNTAHAFGYMAPQAPGDTALPLRHAGNIPADDSLKGKRIRITLDALRVAAYPGSGTHRILFDFYGRNQIADSAEDLHFNATFRVREGQQAAIVGYPIFVGLNVGNAGVAFRCYTVNVKNADDERLLSFLESDVFKAGLQLATTVQPAIAPLSGMAIGLTRMVAGRHRNVPVQDFYLGLDFDNILSGARLAAGSYVAVQIPQSLESIWDWDEWVFNPQRGLIVKKDDQMGLIPYNFIVFGVRHYEES
jgi:hypothetical protein